MWLWYFISCCLFFLLMTTLNLWLQNSALYKRIFVSLIWPITLLSILIYIIKNKKDWFKTRKENKAKDK